MQLDDEEILLQKESAKERLTMEIIAEEKLYPNIHIDINGVGFHSDETLNRVRIYRLKDEIIVESLNGMENKEYDILYHPLKIKEGKMPDKK